MKRRVLLLGFCLSMVLSVQSQISLVQENFGTSEWAGDPAQYPGYTSDAIFGGDAPHDFTTGGSTGYPAASGGAAVLMGSWSGPANTEFVMQYNTTAYINVKLRFGIKHNSDGWGACTLTDNFIKIEYSTDSTNWTTLDKAALEEGSNWPCGDAQVWAWIELSGVLPAAEKLNIRFTHTSPAIHPFMLDDITLTGFPPDNTPPTAPAGLAAMDISFSSFMLSWNAADDDGGISHYNIMKNGKYLMAVTDTLAKVRYQYPGSSADYSVVTVDFAGNTSAESAAIPVVLAEKPLDFTYSWQTPQSKVLPSGDIEWMPEPFEYVAGTSVRYIDYEGGDDANDGLSKATPWKHHPWDGNATGIAAAESGVNTYVFKRGVVYRGHLTATESGTPLEPLRLTSDPSWGTGEAYFFGSQQIEGTWQKADATVAPNIPDPQNVWYVDVVLPETKMVVEVDGDQFRQLHVARSPNYQFTEDDLLRTWWEMTGKVAADGGLWLTDNNNMVQDDPAYYAGATIFSQEDVIVMCTVWKQDVDEWDPDNNRIKVSSTDFGGVGSKYFIENTPFLLDTVNEFYYDEAADRLFVRLEGDKDPNNTVIEAANRTELIKIDGKHDIEISGITFGITTAHGVRYGEEDVRSTIRMTGICNNIVIKNNEFHYVNGGVSLNNAGSTAVNSNAITVSDNDFQVTGDHAIVFSTGGVYNDDINILRNNVFNNGYRHQGRWYSSIPAIYAQLNYGEIAGNIINFSFGNGIDAFWGKGGGSSAYVPFVRGLIHHNKASNTLIGTNDYGGIESWQGGPTYCYNNYSHNGMGYKHYNNSSIGYAYYFDGSFKHVVFNNIASGVSHNQNAAAIMQVLGFYNMYVHNTGYNTNVFLNAWKGTLGLNGYNTYLSNVGEDVGAFFRHQLDDHSDIPFESYGFNVSSGNDFVGAIENRDHNLSLEQFRTTLESYNSQLTQTGFNAEQEVIPNAEVFDFRTLDNSAAIDKGVRFFTAFPLAKVVGEWNFYKHPADLSIIMGDNFYMTEDFNDRTTYKNVPKNHLTAVNVTADHFVEGALENWTEGALSFDGATIHCEVDHAAASAVKSNNVDMTTNDFIIEVFFRTTESHTGGILVSKRNTGSGYELGIDGSGYPVMSLYDGGSPILSATGSVSVNDTMWHHVLVEVSRYRGIDVYVDGELSNGAQTGDMPAPELPLSNSDNLLVGKNSEGNYFSGEMDFLRISKGSLYEAKTSVDELYTWETDGPFLYDMRGNAPEGQRDAGALESTSSCDMTVSIQQIEAGYEASDHKIIVGSEDGYFTRNIVGDFISLTTEVDTIWIELAKNRLLEASTGSFEVVGCNETITITVTQEAAPCEFVCETDTVFIDHTMQSVNVPVQASGTLTVSSADAFVIPSLDSDADTIVIQAEANVSVTERIAEVEIEHCDGTHVITVVQEGAPDNISYMETGNMEIYPNPVTGSVINISFLDGFSGGKYLITDLSGKVVRNGLIHGNNEVLHLELLPGSYLIVVKEASGTEYKANLVVM